MKKYNPFKILLDIESGELQSKPKEISSSLFIVILYLILLTIYHKIIFNVKFQNQFVQISFIIIVSLLFCSTLLVLYKKIYFYDDRIFEPQNKITIKIIVYTIIMTIGFVLFRSIIGAMMQKYINITNHIEMMKPIQSNTTVLIIYGCIIAPLCEEFVMRGVILSGFLKKYDSKISIIISTILFAGVHFDKVQFISATTLGILLALLYSKYKSLILCIIVHCISNSMSGVAVLIAQGNIIICFICSVIGLIIVIVMFMLLNKEDKKRKSKFNSEIYVEAN